MEKYFEINKSGQNIRCKLYYGKSAGIEKAVLFVHGFTGHKARRRNSRTGCCPNIRASRS